MLSNFRSFAQSPLALVIIVLLVLAFAIALPSSGGIFTGSGDAVVTVGPERISQRELSSAFNGEVRRLQDQDSSITAEQARAEGLGEQVLQQQITLAAFAARARELGLEVSNQAIVREVADIPAFLNPVTGEFDRDAMTAALRRVGMSEDQFADNIEGDLLRTQLIATLAGLSGSPDQMAQTRYLVAEERRRVTGLVIDASTADEIADPTDEELQTFIEETPGQNGQPLFTRPEFRAFTLVRLQLQDFIRDVAIDETFLRDTYEYERSTGRLGTPAIRSFAQLNTQDEATAQAAAERLSAGEAPAAIAAALGLGAPLIQEDVQVGDIPDSQLAEAVFGMAAEESAAIEGRFAWSAVLVTAAEEAFIPSFEEERDRLQTSAAQAQATDDLYDAVERFETARADGAILEVAAETAGVPLEIYQPLALNSIDEDLGFDGARYQSLAPELLPAAFDSVEGFAIDLRTFNDTDFFTLRVDSIVPSRPFELEEIREQAESRWRSIQVDTQLRARAEDALAQLEAGDDIELVSLTTGGRTETSTLQRGQTAGAFSQLAMSTAFNMSVGDTDMLQVGEGTYLLMTLNEIIPADIADASDLEMDGISSTIDAQLGDDVLQATRDYLVREYGITDESVDARLFSLAIGETDPNAPR